MSNSDSTRRQFLGTCARLAGLAAVGGVAGTLVYRRDKDKVWQLDPSICDGCMALNASRDQYSRCSTACVLKLSAVKAVNDFSMCGYCMICPGYHDVNSPKGADGLPTGRVCPFDAIVRTPAGLVDPSDPNNNYYQYTIDESKCTGCGKCVIECAKPGQGNGSLRLEVRHDRCTNCNQCEIAKVCPSSKAPLRDSEHFGAFYRDNAGNRQPEGMELPRAGRSSRAAVRGPCGPNPSSNSEGPA